MPTQNLQLTTRFLIFLKIFIHRLKENNSAVLKKLQSTVNTLVLWLKKLHELSLFNHMEKNNTLKYVILINVLL